MIPKRSYKRRPQKMGAGWGKANAHTPTYGIQQVVDPGFSFLANWTFDTPPWTIDNDGLSCDGSQGGASIAAGDTTTIKAGTTYRVIFMLAISAGQVQATIGSTAGTARTTSGFYIEEIVTTDTDGIELLADASFVGAIERVTVEEVF